MKNEGKVLASIILAIGMITAGALLRSAIIGFKAIDRTITVKGLAEREVKANKVIWPLVYKELGNDPAEMYDLLERKNQKVVAFLKSAGLSDSEISINPPTIIDRQADNYGNDIMRYRYRATSVITVTSTDVDKVRKLMNRQTELMKQGIAITGEEYGSNATRYEFTSLNEIKPEMVEEATKNARITAEKFAADSRSNLGSIITAIYDRDDNTPYIKNVRVVNTIVYSLK